MTADRPVTEPRTRLDDLWDELLMDALASDGPIRDADVKNAVKHYRARIEAEAAQGAAPRKHLLYDCGGKGHGPDVSEVQWCHDCTPTCCSEGAALRAEEGGAERRPAPTTASPEHGQRPPAAPRAEGLDERHAHIVGKDRCKCGTTWVEGGGFKGYAFHLEDVLTRLAIEADTQAEVYVDRNLAVQAFAQAMERDGYPVWWGVDESEPDWPVLYIDTDEGQVSWHIPAAERIYEPPIRPEHEPKEWDGHTTPEKFDRLRARLSDERVPESEEPRA